jgi:hypothetical protein
MPLELLEETPERLPGVDLGAAVCVAVDQDAQMDRRRSPNAAPLPGAPGGETRTEGEPGGATTCAADIG